MPAVRWGYLSGSLDWIPRRVLVQARALNLPEAGSSNGSSEPRNGLTTCSPLVVLMECCVRALASSCTASSSSEVFNDWAAVTVSEVCLLWWPPVGNSSYLESSSFSLSWPEVRLAILTRYGSREKPFGEASRELGEAETTDQSIRYQLEEPDSREGQEEWTGQYLERSERK